MQIQRLYIPIAVLIGVVCIGYFAYTSGHADGRAHGRNSDNAVDPINSPADARKGIFALGRIEPRDGVIAVSGLLGERLASIDVVAGDVVEQDDALAVLDGFKIAEANAKLAESDLNRIQDLSKELVTQQQLEQQRLLVKQAQAQLERTRITAPTKGTVLRTFIHAGETIGREPVLQMADLDHMVVIAEVYEADVKRIELDQVAVIRSRAFHPPHDKEGLRGKVIRIGRIIAAPAIQSMSPLASADRHVIEVRIELDKESSSEAAKLINLEVDVWFETAED